MSMMDLAGALGGGGAPPGAGPPGMGPGGPPPSIEVPAEGPEPGAGGGSTIDYLDDAEQALHSFIQEDPDEVDRAKAAQALKIVLDLKAANQQSAQSGDMKSLQRALTGGGPGG